MAQRHVTKSNAGSHMLKNMLKIIVHCVPFFCCCCHICCTCKFLGQGLNLHHGSDLSCYSDHNRSLTHCVTRELHLFPFSWWYLREIGIFLRPCIILKLLITQTWNIKYKYYWLLLWLKWLWTNLCKHLYWVTMSKY